MVFESFETVSDDPNRGETEFDGVTWRQSYRVYEKDESGLLDNYFEWLVRTPGAARFSVPDDRIAEPFLEWFAPRLEADPNDPFSVPRDGFNPWELGVDGVEIDVEASSHDLSGTFMFFEQDYERQTLVRFDVAASDTPQTIRLDGFQFGGFGNISIVCLFLNDGEDPVMGLDVTLSEIRLVPAPASLALLGAAGLATRRRRA